MKPSPQRVLFNSEHPISAIHINSLLDTIEYGNFEGEIFVHRINDRTPTTKNINRDKKKLHSGVCLSIESCPKIGTYSLGKEGNLIRHSDEASIQLDHNTFSNTALSSKSTIWAPGNLKSSVCIIDSVNWKCVSEPIQWSNRGILMKINHCNENQMLLSFEDGSVIVIDDRYLTNKLKDLKIFDNNPVMYVDISFKEEIAILSNPSEDVKILNFANDFNVKQVQKSKDSLNLQLTTDCKSFIHSNKKGDVLVRDFNEQSSSKVIAFHRLPLNCIQLSADKLACGGNDCLLSVWSLLSSF